MHSSLFTSPLPFYPSLKTHSPFSFSPPHTPLNRQLQVQSLSKNHHHQPSSNIINPGTLDSPTTLSSFSTCTNTSHHLYTLDFFKKNGKFPSLSHCNHLLVSLINTHRFGYAKNLFSNLVSFGFPPNSQTFTVMVHCFCKKNEPDEAKIILESMVANGFSPSVVTFTILIDTFCKKRKLRKAFDVFGIMGRIGCKPTIRTMNCLIHGLCLVGRVEEALELFTKIKKSSKKPDIYTISAVMDGLCKVGRSDEGRDLLGEALEMGLSPTAVSYNALFNGYCEEGRPLEGINLLKQMVERDCRPDYISCITLLHGLLKWNENPAALGIYEEMLSFGFEISDRMMNTLVRGICRDSIDDDSLLKDGKELFRKIKEMGHHPFPNTYSSMIHALSIGGDMDEAVINLHEMIKIGYSPKMMTYNTIIQGLCRKGRVDDAFFILVFMIKESVNPIRILYNILVDGFNLQGRGMDACKVYAVALKRGVVPDQRPWDHLVHKRYVVDNFFVQEMELAY